MDTKLIRIVYTLFIVAGLLTLWSCKPLKTALELNDNAYSKIVNKPSSMVNTEGVYVLKEVMVNTDSSAKNETVTELIKFNNNKTVQFSEKHISHSSKAQITNNNLTNWLNDYTSSYYYTKKNSKLIVEHYIANPIRKSWYALDGPASAPLKFKLQFKISGDTLIKNGKRYILNKTLTNNHKTITTDFISLNK